MEYLLTYLLYVAVLSVLMGISTWKFFRAMGYHPALAFVPFYNYSIIQKETGHPRWWVVLAYLPIVGPIMMSVFHLFLMRHFGRRSLADQVLTVVLPFIYMAYVNYSSTPEVEKPAAFDFEDEEETGKKDTFLGSVTFAVVFATVIHVFFTQPFGIPTGSMERTLMVGDFLFVNKWSYGYRLPMRPLAIPFLQGTIMDTGEKGNPKDDPKSYAEGVKLPYQRIFQFKKPQRNDIVVFNYPQDSVHIATDRKDPYVKRCVAVAGDELEMRAGRLFVNGKPEVELGDQQKQHKYIVTTGSQLDIQSLYKIYGFLPVQEIPTDNGFIYDFQGLTDQTAKDIEQLPQVIEMKEHIWPKDSAAVAYKINAAHDAYTKNIDSSQSIFPINKKWNQDWYGPLRVPKKGDVVPLTQETLPEYQWIISEYEHHHLENKNGQIFIDGKPATQYTIEQDYYMMIGDNRDASLDARFFGFVPEENIVGSPMFTWLSVEGLFPDRSSSYQPDGKRLRWDRMFKATNTGEAEKTSYWWIAAIVLILFFGWDFFAKLFRKKEEE
ncbi:signal peptidase I [Chryseobacterium salipaludis]|uniref:signal peptidase I n=1 Tax=Chryseobacterium TaxID=59732 RepID=UPI001FF542D8|nr:MULTISPECIES: signal peptidase I [Chryseobacterium]MCJ8498106.1 signal peptidase I [Chryseobacterium salipaludis]MCX3296695.1 signal peptidase I [Planobacterium sp. JC490]